jgi:hypothetical protein
MANNPVMAKGTARKDLIQAIETRGEAFFASGLASVTSQLLCQSETVFLDPNVPREIRLRLIDPSPSPETFRPLDKHLRYYICSVPRKFSGTLELSVSHQEEGKTTTVSHNIPFGDRESFSASIMYLLSVYKHKDKEEEEPKDVID